MRLSCLLAGRRVEILERWTRRIAQVHTDKELSGSELWDHLPKFFDEVLAALRAEEGSSGHAVMPKESTASVTHGVQRLQVGLHLVEVIREYEILTDCILDEVEAAGGSISTRAFRRVLALLNAGRAQAVSAYIAHRDAEIDRLHSRQVAFIAHELRNPLANAFMGVTALRKAGRPEDQWALGMLTRNLTSLRELIDQALTADRLKAQIPLRREPFDLRALLDQSVAEAQLTADQSAVTTERASGSAWPSSSRLSELTTAGCACATCRVRGAYSLLSRLKRWLRRETSKSVRRWSPPCDGCRPLGASLRHERSALAYRRRRF